MYQKKKVVNRILAYTARQDKRVKDRYKSETNMNNDTKRWIERVKCYKEMDIKVWI